MSSILSLFLPSIAPSGLHAARAIAAANAACLRVMALPAVSELAPINAASLAAARGVVSPVQSAMHVIRSRLAAALGAGKSVFTLPGSSLTSVDAVMSTADLSTASNIADSGVLEKLRGVADGLGQSCTAAFRFLSQHFMALPFFGKMLVGVVVVVVVCGVVVHFFLTDAVVPFATGSVCPITQDSFVDPVVTADGHTYERWAIQAWFNTGRTTSPLTNLPLRSLDLFPNLALRAQLNVA